MVSADDVGVTCHCNHTTNFAAFMSPYENEYDLTDSQSLVSNFRVLSHDFVNVFVCDWNNR